MNPFEYVQADSANKAVALLSDEKDRTKVIAGGIDLLGELKDHLIEPKQLIGITGIAGLDSIQEDGGSLKIGATAILADIASHSTIRSKHTALAESAGVVGSPQIRNAGTLGGNLCQRPRCWYFRGEFYHCLKKGGTLCYAVAGRNQYHAILGGTPCFIVHPSDCAPALIALGAKLKLLSPQGNRTIALEDFFILPSENLTSENTLQSREIIEEIEIPAHNLKSTYVKFREKEGFDWAISSVAVALELEGQTCKKANIILGGVAPKPWRAKKAEALLTGKPITEELAKQAGEASVDGAEPLSDNAYKISITQSIVKDAILKFIA